MTSARLFKFFALLSLSAAAIAGWLWHTTGEAPEPWLIRIATVACFAALLLAVINPETRPRLMLRFLAALFALFALIAFAADISRLAGSDGSVLGVSLLRYLDMYAPSFVEGLERIVSRSIASGAWDPFLTTLMSLPASLIFLLLAIGAGYLGRPRRRVRIFVNDY